METKMYLRKLIDKIEQSITEKVNIEQLSAECFVSPRKLYRDFYCFTGHSVNEYIRKRRLSKALSLLKHSDMTIADIAYSCGYSSQQALCKSIKSSILMTPTEYRDSTTTYYFPTCKDEKSRKVVVESKTIPQLICLKFYSSQLIGIEDKAIKYLQFILPGYMGKLYGRNGQQQGNQFCYEVFIEYDDKYISTIMKSDFKEFNITPQYNGIFAQTAARNNEQIISEAWNYLYGHWLKNSMFELDVIPYFEEYIIKDCEVKRLVLHLPVKPRENFHKIRIQAYDKRLFVISTQNSEKSAANIVTNFIAHNHPYILHEQKEYYISKQNNMYSSGISLGKPVDILGEKLELLSVSEGLYAVLEGNCYGSGDEYEQILLQWLHENGFESVGNSFSIYDVSKGSEQNNIVVKSQVRIKDGRIG